MQSSKNECKKSTDPIADPDDAECDAIPTWFVVAVSAVFVAWVFAVFAVIASRFL